MTTLVSITELKRMTVSELRKDLAMKRIDAAKVRMGLALQSEKNHAAYRVMKRDIARMTMVLADMERSGTSEKSGKSEMNNDDKTASKSEKNDVKHSGSKTVKAKVSTKKIKKS